MKSKVSKILAGLGAAALMSWAGQASATEAFTPFQPGISTGVPSGALPPPGFYAGLDNAFLWGPVTNNNGDNVPVNVWVDTFVPSIVYVPNFQLFGATLAAAFVQPYILKGVSFAALGPSGAPGILPNSASLSQGLFNTIISPINAAWNFQNGFFAKAGLAIYLPDGYYVSQTTGGVKHVGSATIATNYWTFEPDFAVSYLANGLNLTAHAVFDLNLENNDTHYQSGHMFYIDLTATQQFGKWAFGAGFNFTQQLTDDTINGVTVGANGNKEQHILLGPIVEYNFGPIAAKVSYLAGLRAENAANFSAFHLGFALPLQ